MAMPIPSLRGGRETADQGHDLRDRARGPDQLGEIIVERVASVDLVRFSNSGSEATMNAVRAARAFTGRDLIVKMEVAITEHTTTSR